MNSEDNKHIIELPLQHHINPQLIFNSDCIF